MGPTIIDSRIRRPSHKQHGRCVFSDRQVSENKPGAITGVVVANNVEADIEDGNRTGRKLRGMGPVRETVVDI